MYSVKPQYFTIVVVLKLHVTEDTVENEKFNLIYDNQINSVHASHFSLIPLAIYYIIYACACYIVHIYLRV